MIAPDQQAVFQIEPMLEEDVREVSRLEGKCFTNPWPISAYRRELKKPHQNFYIVLRQTRELAEAGDSFEYGVGLRATRRLIDKLPIRSIAGLGDGHSSRSSIVGFAGFWHAFDEAHITTIAVSPDLRRRQLGERLLVALIDEARLRGAGFLALEVRKSNAGAIRLYEKYGFQINGVRRAYYTDDGEDAWVMRSPTIRSDEFVREYQMLTRRLDDCLDGLVRARLPADSDSPPDDALWSHTT